MTRFYGPQTYLNSQIEQLLRKLHASQKEVEAWKRSWNEVNAYWRSAFGRVSDERDSYYTMLVDLLGWLDANHPGLYAAWKAERRLEGKKVGLE